VDVPDLNETYSDDLFDQVDENTAYIGDEGSLQQSLDATENPDRQVYESFSNQRRVNGEKGSERVENFQSHLSDIRYNTFVSSQDRSGLILVMKEGKSIKLPIDEIPEMSQTHSSIVEEVEVEIEEGMNINIEIDRLTPRDQFGAN